MLLQAIYAFFQVHQGGVRVDKLTVRVPDPPDPRTPGQGPRDYTERFDFGVAVPGETLVFRAERAVRPDYSGRIYTIGPR